MAIGLTPSHTERFAVVDLTIEQFIVIAVDAAKQLHWNTHVTLNMDFTAYRGEEEITVTLESDTVVVKSTSTGRHATDREQNKKNTQAFITAFKGIKASLSSEDLSRKYKKWLIQQITTYYKETAPPPPPTSTKEDLRTFVSHFVPKKGYFVTPLLLDLNIGIFFLMVGSGVDIWNPASTDLIHWGASFKPLVLGGEWWRLLSACFVHIGFLHLLMNLLALFFIGFILEPYLGMLRLTTVYLLTGLAASVTSLWWHNATAVSAGASGAIFGLYGAFLALLTTNLIEKGVRSQLLYSIVLFVVYNLLFGMRGNIDNAAHLGGLVSGLVAGYLFYPSLKKSQHTLLRYSSVAMVSLVILCAAVSLFRALPNNISKYDMGIQTFKLLEAEALSLYPQMWRTKNEKQVTAIMIKGVEQWKKGQKLLTELEKLKLTGQQHRLNKALLHYCTLRIKSYEIYYNLLKNETGAYGPEYDRYNQQLSATLADMKGQGY